MPPRLWIAVTRPDNLINACAVAAAAQGRFSACHLLYEQSSWWRTVDWSICPTAFDAVHSVDKVPTCRGIRDLPRFYRALKCQQQALADLRIAPDDAVVTLSGITRLGIALASVYPGVRNILCTTIKKALDASRPVSWMRYRFTTSSLWQHFFIEPRLGLRRTLHLKPWWGGGDGVRLERPQEALEDVFDAVVVLSNDGADLPPAAGPTVHPARFPSLHDLAGWTPEVSGDRRTVVFFGTPFLLVRNLPPGVYRERLDRCLDYLRRCYGATHTLVYRPHPAETDERGQLDLQGFAIEEDGEIAELYFLRHFRRIGAVFSVSSTVSRVALNYGLNGYALWRCFPFDAAATEYFRSLMGRVPAEFDLRSLEQPPVEYAGARGEAETTAFADVLGRVL